VLKSSLVTRKFAQPTRACARAIQRDKRVCDVEFQFDLADATLEIVEVALHKLGRFEVACDSAL
jgi:hypothetical protein